MGDQDDAKNIKDNEVLYRGAMGKAEGTVTSGERVIVTRAEVAWAGQHPASA